MGRLSPLVACVWFFGVKGNSQQRLEAKLFIQWLAHGRRFHPAFQIELVSAHNSHIHKQTADTPESMSGIHCHPIECCFSSQRLEEECPKYFQCRRSLG
jgi:hypothetical protein